MEIERERESLYPLYSLYSSIVPRKISLPVDVSEFRGKSLGIGGQQEY